MVFQTEKALKDVGDKIDAGQKSTVEADLSNLKAVLERTKEQTDMSDADIDALKSGKYDEKFFLETPLYPDQMVFLIGAFSFGAGAPTSGQMTYACLPWDTASRIAS